MKNNSQNTAIKIINLCLIIMFFGLFFSSSTYANQDNGSSQLTRLHFFNDEIVKTAPLQIDSNVFPDYNQNWIGIVGVMKNYISNPANYELFFTLVVKSEFKFLTLDFIKFKRLIDEQNLNLCFINNLLDYPRFHDFLN